MLNRFLCFSARSPSWKGHQTEFLEDEKIGVIKKKHPGWARFFFKG